MIYHDENNKPMGYDIKSGRKLLKTDTFKNFTRHGVNRVGYKRKKKTKKTQKVQYAEDDNHHVQKRIFGNSGMSFNGQGGSFIHLSNKQYKIIEIYKLRNLL